MVATRAARNRSSRSLLSPKSETLPLKPRAYRAFFVNAMGRRKEAKASKPNRRITKKTSPKKVAKAKKKDKSEKEGGSNAKSASQYFLTTLGHAHSVQSDGHERGC